MEKTNESFDFGRGTKNYTIEEQQFNLILNGDKNRPVLIGASLKENPEDTAQREKNQNKKNNIINNAKRKTENGAIKLYELYSEHKADVLNPEKYLDNNDWSFALNVAFIQGAIESKRKIKLVTKSSVYQEMDHGILNNGTFWELLSLQRCGYEFYTEEGKIVAIQGSQFKGNPPL